MMDDVYVFLGPTLPVEEARQILNARYLPPVAMGDVYALMARRPQVIAIVDGLFEQRPAVWHKEILFALSRGVRVLGASSMGALRAAELHAFGMEGVGEIFGAFMRGQLTDDDEVTVVHGPAADGWRPLSDAMVNLRLGLRLAETAGAIGGETHRRLIELGKALFYPERSWPALIAEGHKAGLPVEELQALRAFVRREQPDQKRADARQLLAHLAELARAPIAPHRPEFDFEPTLFWQLLADSMAPIESAEGARAEQLRDHVRLGDPERRELIRGALLLVLVRMEARRRGIKVDLASALRRFRRARRLHSAAALSEWIAQNRIGRDQCAELAELEAQCDELAARYQLEIDRLLGHELRRRGRFAQVVGSLEDKLQILKQQGIQNPTLADTGADMETVLSWYQGRHEVVETDVERHAVELGFGSARSFFTELFAQYLQEHRS
jgi:hypothetical protein